MHFTLINTNQEFILEKSEERHLCFYSTENIIQVAVQLDGYETEPMPIKFLKKSYETSIKLKSLQNRNSTLNLYVNFSDEKSGCYITFYVKTCFINACSLPLTFYNTTKVS